MIWLHFKSEDTDLRLIDLPDGLALELEVNYSHKSFTSKIDSAESLWTKLVLCEESEHLKGRIFIDSINPINGAYVSVDNQLLNAMCKLLSPKMIKEWELAQAMQNHPAGKGRK